MQAEAPDETVEHAEKLASERIFETQYDVWDVHTDKDRWWVVRPPTNLYSQRDFKSMDGILSFHIGLTTRITARQAREAPTTHEPRLERTRRQWEQAAEAQVEADEAEEFQAVGAQCRETLLSFVHGMASEALVPEDTDPPKASDFIHWIEHIANALAPGASAVRLRSYLKAVAKETWDYVAWLTHARNAVRFDGTLAVEMVAHTLSVFEQAIERKERGGPDRCPSCSSYRVIGDEMYDFDSGTVSRRRLCEACNWSEIYEPEPLGMPQPAQPPPEGDCQPSSEI